MTRPLHGFVLGVVFLTACGAERVQAPDAGTPASIRKTRGDYQRADPGATLPSRLTAVVTDAADAPVPQVPIEWWFHVGAGRLDPASNSTDMGGKASTTVHLGSNVSGLVQVGARVVDAAGLETMFWVLVGDAVIDPPTVRPDASVHVGDGYFNPSQVTVAPGGIVMWTLEGEQSHRIYLRFSTGGTPPPNVRIFSGAPHISGTGSFLSTMADTGSYRFLCGTHPQTSPTGWVHVR